MTLNKSLNEKEAQFICTIASDFIEGYSVNGKIKLDGGCDSDEILDEITICKSLINKLKN